MLKGPRIRLRAVEPEDYRLLWEWLNDEEVMVHWGRPGNTESLPQVIRREEEEAARPTSRKFIVETHENQPIGQIDYYDANWQTRSAWVSIMIGVPGYWGSGYGSEAMRTLLHYLFNQLGLHRVTLTVHASNVRAIRSYEKNGFVSEGRLRDWHYLNGRWEDGLIMSVLEDDFRRLAPSQQLG